MTTKGSGFLVPPHALQGRGEVRKLKISKAVSTLAGTRVAWCGARGGARGPRAAECRPELATWRAGDLRGRVTQSPTARPLARRTPIGPPESSGEVAGASAVRGGAGDLAKGKTETDAGSGGQTRDGGAERRRTRTGMEDGPGGGGRQGGAGRRGRRTGTQGDGGAGGWRDSAWSEVGTQAGETGKQGAGAERGREGWSPGRPEGRPAEEGTGRRPPRETDARARPGGLRADPKTAPPALPRATM